MDEIAVNRYLAEQDIFHLFCRQLQKDFEGAGAGTSLLDGITGQPARVREIILGAVRHITQTARQQLPSLLYRIDIGEKKLKEFAVQHPSLTFEEVVSELILRRILQKVILKRRFSNE